MKKLFIISLFAMLPILSEAQESVEEIGPFKDNYSIIRELNQKESLIYNCYQGLSIFTLTYEGTSTIETAAQGYQFQYIRDFEILNGEDVYLIHFCLRTSISELLRRAIQQLQNSPEICPIARLIRQLYGGKSN